MTRIVTHVETGRRANNNLMDTAPKALVNKDIPDYGFLIGFFFYLFRSYHFQNKFIHLRATIIFIQCKNMRDDAK